MRINFNLILKKNIKKLKQIIIINPDADAVIQNISKHLDISQIDIVRIKTFEDLVLNHLDNYLQ